MSSCASPAITETGESIVPDSTTTNLERAEEFSRGQDILFKQKDGKYYLGTVATLDPAHERCLVKFMDGTESWALFKQLERLSSAPSVPPPVPPSSAGSDGGLGPTALGGESGHRALALAQLRMCVVCKRTGRDVAVCSGCGRGYHGACHQPAVVGELDASKAGAKWVCRRCYDTEQVRQVQKRLREPCKTTKHSNNRIEVYNNAVPKETVDTLKKFKLPYELTALSWDTYHLQNAQQRYCYCGGPGDWQQRMLQCGRCRQWFHARCVTCLRRPLYAGDRFYVFVCALCHRRDCRYDDLLVDEEGEEEAVDVESEVARRRRRSSSKDGDEIEYIRRLELKWVDLVHLMLFNLTTFNARKYYDLDTVLIPYIQDNWHALQLPLKISHCTPSERRDNILSVLTTNRNRFKCGRELKRRTTIWGLRVRLPPPAPSLPLPPGVPVSDAVLRDHWAGNRRLQFLPAPILGSEHTMGGLLVTRALMHSERVVGIMRGVAYQDSADSEIEEDISPPDTPFIPHPASRTLLDSSANTHISAAANNSAILRQRPPVQYAPGSVKKSASAVPYGTKKTTYDVIKALDLDDETDVRKMVEFNRPTYIPESNTGVTSAKSGHSQTEDVSQNAFAGSNQNKRRLQVIKRNETRKLLRRKCRMEQQKKTQTLEKRRTRLSLDASKSTTPLSDYPPPSTLPPTPPTSVSAPPTPPATTTSDCSDTTTTTTTNTKPTRSNNTTEPVTTCTNAKLTRSNLADHTKQEPTGFNTPCDTSGDETSSKSTLDLIIPPPKDFEGRNNPFRNSVLGGGGGGGDKKKDVGVIKGGSNATGGVVKPTGKALKRQLSVKDIRIGPNGEVKRRRMRRCRSNSNGAAAPVAVNTSSLTGDDSWAPSVGNCMEYVLNGRRLRVRQEKQGGAGVGVLALGDDGPQKKLLLGGVMDVVGSVTPKASPGKQESDISMDELKSSVSSYFGAATRIAAGERYTIRARRIGPTGNLQYLIEWDGPNHADNTHNLNATHNLNSIINATHNLNATANSTHNLTNTSTDLSFKYGSTPAKKTSHHGGGSSSKGAPRNGGAGSSKGGGSSNVSRVLALDTCRVFPNEV